MHLDINIRTNKYFVYFDVFTGICHATDLALFAVCGFSSYILYLQHWPIRLSYESVIILAAFLSTIFHSYLGIYRFDDLGRPFRQTLYLLLGVLGAFLVLAALGFSIKTSSTFSRGWVALWFALAGVSFLSFRLLLTVILKRGRRSGWLIQNLAVVGAGKTAERFIQRFQAAQSPNALILGVFDDGPERTPETLHGVPLLGRIEDLKTFARTCRIDEVVIALPSASEDRLLDIVEELRLLAVDVRLIMSDLSFDFPDRPMNHLAGVPMLALADRPVSHWKWAVKLLEDKILATIILLVLAIPLGIITLLIKIDDPGEVLFRQKRYGLNSRVFDLYKFRTMYANLADETGERQTERNDVRVTRIGRLLRRWSLDELPQIFNVLKGDMSLVGPRPHALASKIGDQLFESVAARYAARHRIKPGITGLAQVRGWRGAIDSSEKIRMRVSCDIEYIEKWSLLFDFWILLLTVRVVLRRDNAY